MEDEAAAEVKDPSPPGSVEELERELERARDALAASERRLAGTTEHAGDAGEVGEYLDAQRDQELFGRLAAFLEERLLQARLLEHATDVHDVAEIGAHAEFEDVETHFRSSFELVSSPESNIASGRLSVDAPVGRALLGHHAGDVVEVITPKGRRRLRLLDVR